jgi:hypothetical protein
MPENEARGCDLLRPSEELIGPSVKGTMPLPWEEARARLAEARYYWLTSIHPSGRPHSRPVLAVWVGGYLCTTTSPMARKGRNLGRDPRCSVAVLADDLHVVLEGSASRPTDAALLAQIAHAYRSKYDWPVEVVGGAFDAQYGAPTAGPPPYQPYQVTPTTVYGFVTDDAIGPRHTRWRF